MNPKITWRLIPNSKHYYVSENGDVYNDKTKQYIATKNPSNGYKKVSINGKSLYVHVLVCTLFNGAKPIGGRYTVDHIDRDKMNNKAKNLRWVTQKVNNSNRKHKGTRTQKLTLKQWLMIVGEYLNGQLSQYAITKWFLNQTGINICPQNIGKLFKGTTYSKWYTTYLTNKQRQRIQSLTIQRKP